MTHFDDMEIALRQLARDLTETVPDQVVISSWDMTTDGREDRLTVTIWLRERYKTNYPFDAAALTYARPTGTAQWVPVGFTGRIDEL